MTHLAYFPLKLTKMSENMCEIWQHIIWGRLFLRNR